MRGASTSVTGAGGAGGAGAGGGSTTGEAEIFASYNTTCSRSHDNALRCWGDNSGGQLGNGTTVASATPLLVTGAGSITSAAPGKNHTCVIVGNDVSCIGTNDFGQLGNDSTEDSNTLVSSNAGLAKEIASSDSFSCAVRTNGTVVCWGKNAFGNLGNGTTSTPPVTNPTNVVGLSNAANVSLGIFFGCALAAEGVRCWGSNS